MRVNKKIKKVMINLKLIVRLRKRLNWIKVGKMISRGLLRKETSGVLIKMIMRMIHLLVLAMMTLQV